MTNEEPIQFISLIVCLLGIVGWIGWANTRRKFAGLAVFPISVFIMTGLYYSVVVLTDIEHGDPATYLWLGAVLRLYSLLVLTLGSFVMLLTTYAQSQGVSWTQLLQLLLQRARRFWLRFWSKSG